MKFVRAFSCILLSLWTTVYSKCPSGVIAPLGYVVEHAVWRGWHQVFIFYNTLESDCSWTLIRLVKCLGINGIASAVNIESKVTIDTTSGIVIFVPRYNPYQNSTEKFTAIIKQLANWEMNTASYDWLIVAQSLADYTIIRYGLNATAGRFDQNIVAVLPDMKKNKNVELDLCKHNFSYRKKEVFRKRNFQPNHKIRYFNSSPCINNDTSLYNCNRTEHEINYFRTSDRFKNISRLQNYERFGKSIPLWRSGILSFNFSASFHTKNISHFSLRNSIKKWKNLYDIKFGLVEMHILQFFKVRFNSTLFVTYLGLWSREGSMTTVESPYPVEARKFMGEKFIFGRCNASNEGSAPLENNELSMPEKNESEMLNDILSFLTLRLNATPVTRYYNKLGFRTYEGAWTGLLGALMDHSVDIALEPVTALASPHKDMDFIFPIAKTMCNIYIRHQETSAVRDIFLAPFKPQLLACVICIAVSAAMVIFLISKIKFCDASRSMTCTEALIWSSGILCQQGGSWTPSSSAGSMLLIVCLLFSLVTYNAYAAFITSVLSVRVSSVGSLADVLQSPNIKIGYVKNGVDQMYLMSTKDVQLNAFYIRGYSEAENLVTSTEEGLVRAAMQDYAFFSGQRVARSTLRSLSQARGRCALRELPVLSTRTQLAFPLLSSSPYARSILVSLLQLRSSGALARLEAALVPGMPQCSPPSGFASARAADVKTALLVILIGLTSSFVIGVAEYSWKNRIEFKRYMKKSFFRIFNYN